MITKSRTICISPCCCAAPPASPNRSSVWLLPKLVPIFKPLTAEKYYAMRRLPQTAKNDHCYGLIPFLIRRDTSISLNSNGRRDNDLQNMKTSPGPVESIMWGALFTCAGPILLVVGLKMFYTEVRPRWWKKHPATIVKSEIKHESAQGGNRQQFLPIVEYEYVYNGKIFRGIGSFFTIGTRESAALLLSQYPLAASVVVYVNPRKPAQSAVNARITPASCFFLTLGSLFTLIAFICRTDLEDYFRTVSQFSE